MLRQFKFVPIRNFFDFLYEGAKAFFDLDRSRTMLLPIGVAILKKLSGELITGTLRATAGLADSVSGFKRFPH